jgi:hypothetical protein
VEPRGPAEDRYQTAGGVERDLRRCLAEWEARRRHSRAPPYVEKAVLHLIQTWLCSIRFITSTSPEQVAEDAGTLPNRFVNGLAAKISPSSLPVEEILARAAATSGDRREQEHSGAPVASKVNS